MIYKDQKFNLLSKTTDMSCYSFSLPAGKEGSCPLAVTGEGSICDSCYAQINRYNMPNVLKAQWLRFMWIKDHLRSRIDRNVVITTLVTEIRKSVKNGYFRVHDSGDFFDPRYILIWYYICLNLPDIKFWFPTRAYWSTSKSWQIALANLGSLDNVSLKNSALYYDAAPPQNGSTVISSEEVLNRSGFRNVKLCPKTLNGGSCETNNCRSCWSSDTTVAYLTHGYMGRISIPIISDKIKKLRSNFKEQMINLSINRKEIYE